MHGRCLRLLVREWREHLERGLGLADDALRGAQDQTRTRVAGARLQDLVRLLGGQARVLAQQPRRMRERHLERPNGLRCPGHDSRPWRSPVPHGDTRLHALR